MCYLRASVLQAIGFSFSVFSDVVGRRVNPVPILGTLFFYST
jgi:hypothetical protein